ncbi:unannotated protein [freshwater metagenome]|uniref:Unannotated protein n=1 Tax=freshwater metagenome TaxID=449393 RepID=A0A6J6H6V8_9ZZZZ|nr:hypothetical protein [Actinomycetota bacterium]
MSNSRHDPRNRQRPAAPRKKSVYLRRRIIALAVLVALVAIVWNLIAGAVGLVQNMFGGNNPAPAGSSVAAGAACTTESILLEPVVADAGGGTKAAFDTGINPFFGYKITNIGTKDCTIDLGAKDTYFRVTSGTETIWDSANCDRTALVSNVVTLKPNETMSSAMSDWYRVKSSSTGCGADQTPVKAGGASYHLSVEVGGAVSKETSQFVLN